MSSKNNPFDYFEKIYCINLDSRPDRWEQFLKFAKELGIEDRVERISAVVRDDVKDPKYGCLLSHYTIMKSSKENNLKNYFVFEDDASFLYKDFNWWSKYVSGFNNKEKLKLSIDELKKQDWELFYLGWLGQKPSKCKNYTDQLMKINNPYCLHSYGMSNIAYDKYIVKIEDTIKQVENDTKESFFAVDSILGHQNCHIDESKVFCPRFYFITQNNFGGSSLSRTRNKWQDRDCLFSRYAQYRSVKENINIMEKKGEIIYDKLLEDTEELFVNEAKPINSNEINIALNFNEKFSESAINTINSIRQIHPNANIFTNCVNVRYDTVKRIQSLGCHVYKYHLTSRGQTNHVKFYSRTKLLKRLLTEEKLNHVLYMDSDALILKDLSKIGEMCSGYDIGIFKREIENINMKVLTGLIYFKSSPNVLKFVEEWELLAKDGNVWPKSVWDQETFYEALQLNKDIKVFDFNNKKVLVVSKKRIDDHIIFIAKRGRTDIERLYIPKEKTIDKSNSSVQNQKSLNMKNVNTNSEPMVVHFNGRSYRNLNKDIYDECKNWCFSEDIKTYFSKFSFPKELTIFTVANKSDYMLLKFAEHVGIPIVQLGADIKKDDWVYGHKIKLYMEALQNCKTEYAICADASDVLFIDHPLNVLEKFKTMNKDVLFNAEKHCYRCKSRAHDFFHEKIKQGDETNFKYFNSGLCIGKTKNLLSCWGISQKHIITEKCSCDQSAMVRLMVSGILKDIEIDTSCELLQSVCNIEDELIIEKTMDER
jgi:hypothetical protein